MGTGGSSSFREYGRFSIIPLCLRFCDLLLLVGAWLLTYPPPKLRRFTHLMTGSRKLRLKNVSERR